MNENAEKAIILVDADGRHSIPAPEGFDWLKYPAVVVRKGRPYYYFGTVDGYPHYKAS